MNQEFKSYLDERLGEMEKLIMARLDLFAATRPTRKELVGAVVVAITVACAIMGVAISLAG